MKITLEGCGNRGYRHTLVNVDVSSLKEFEAGAFRAIDASNSQLSCFRYGRDQPLEDKSVYLQRVVDIRTNGNYVMNIELTVRDVLFLAWVVMKDRSVGWLGDQFTRIGQSVSRSKEAA